MKRSKNGIERHFKYDFSHFKLLLCSTHGKIQFHLIKTKQWARFWCVCFWEETYRGTCRKKTKTKKRKREKYFIFLLDHHDHVKWNVSCIYVLVTWKRLGEKWGDLTVCSCVVTVVPARPLVLPVQPDLASWCQWHAWLAFCWLVKT